MEETKGKPIPSDRRSRKSEKFLLQGLIALLKERDIKDITVRELTDFADVSRSTFYAHYRDIFDMIEKIEADMLLKFSGAINSHQNEIREGNFRPMLISVYSFLKEYGGIFSVLMGRFGELGFKTDFRIIAGEKLTKEWLGILSGNSQDPYYDYKCSFTVMGAVGLMQTWLSRNMQETPEQMAKMTEQFVIRGMGK